MAIQALIPIITAIASKVGGGAAASGGGAAAGTTGAVGGGSAGVGAAGKVAGGAGKSGAGLPKAGSVVPSFTPAFGAPKSAYADTSVDSTGGRNPGDRGPYVVGTQGTYYNPKDISRGKAPSDQFAPTEKNPINPRNRMSGVS